MEKNKEQKENKKPKLIRAYDPIIRVRVPYVVSKGKAISLVTGHSFKLTKKHKKAVGLK